MLIAAFLLQGCQDSDEGGGISLSSTTSAAAFNNSGWSEKTSDDPNVKKLTLDETTFRARLDAIAFGGSNEDVAIPLPDGTIVNVSVIQTELLDDDYKDSLPDARTWDISSNDERIAGGTMSFTAFGYNIMLIMTDGSITYIDSKNETGADRYYISYNDKHEHEEGINCDVDHEQLAASKSFAERLTSTLTNTGIRQYRMAPVSTVAFHDRFGWLNGSKSVGNTWNYMYNLINRSGFIMKRDLSVQLRIVGNAWALVPQDRVDDVSLIPNLDPQGNITSFTHKGQSQILRDNLNHVNQKIGVANYDMAHVFDNTNAGGSPSGLAGVGVTCDNGGHVNAPWHNKAAGYSDLGGSNNLNNFAISVLAHEIGHQLGADHTFSSASCGNGTITSSAVEPGSGTTIMSYAGICGTNDNVESAENLVQAERMFHARSVEDVHRHVHNGAGAFCGTRVNFNRNPQVDLDEMRQNRLVIPARTPFILDGVNIVDPDGQGTYHAWEQVLPGATSGPSRLNQDTGDNGLVLSYPPLTRSTQRIVPSLEAIRSAQRVDGEVAPSRSRNQLRFRFLARDNIGGVGYDDIDIHVEDTGRPFRIYQPSTTQVGAGTLTVQWDVASTNLPPISCANVDIAASQNNGRIFTTLLTNTPNDGTVTVNIPSWLATNQTRIRVKCSTDIFFAMSATNPSAYTASR
jgi:hypothetical protein